MEQKRGIQYFPIALFSSVMGVSGLGIAIRQLERLYDSTTIASTFITILATLLFIFNVVIFIIRASRHPEVVKLDFQHPVKMNFFAAISISLLLLGSLFYEFHIAISFLFWVAGAVLQVYLTVTILTKLMWNTSFQLAQFNPAWFIPIVGNMVVPLAGIHHVGKDINWLFFSIGILFSIIYYTIFFKRIMFQPPLPVKLIPTMFILLAPAGIGFVSYVNLVGQVDVFAYILYGVAFYLGLLFIFQLKRFITIPFFVSWWAYLFPSAAVTIATITMYRFTEKIYYYWLFHIQVSALILLTLYLLWKTIELAKMRKLCLREE